MFFLWILFFVFLVTLNYIEPKTLYGHGIDYSHIYLSFRNIVKAVA